MPLGCQFWLTENVLQIAPRSAKDIQLNLRFSHSILTHSSEFGTLNSGLGPLKVPPRDVTRRHAKCQQ